uniref:phosphatase PAP2 family protein n=1 Tax=Escherichia coli TaxID=562 RepID=UPI0025B75DF3|nr:phosphatase PAP2 family protein [Escherichia coli]WIW82346.1 hypothetical protein CJEBIMFD_00005 [Escherichia coli]
MVADWFYLGMGHWMVAKQAFLPDLLLYSGLKKLLMAMLIYLLVATICRAYHEKKGNAITAKWLVPVTKFRVRELAYLVLTLILVPTVVASLKAYTHVVCPVHLTIFDGTLPYLPMLDSMRNTIPDKCFPAAHASSGFALFAFAFAPSLRRRRGAIIIVVMALGWAMGCYKMSRAAATAVELIPMARRAWLEHGHSCFLCEIVIRSQFHTTYEPEA